MRPDEKEPTRVHVRIRFRRSQTKRTNENKNEQNETKHKERQTDRTKVINTKKVKRTLSTNDLMMKFNKLYALQTSQTIRPVWRGYSE